MKNRIYLLILAGLLMVQYSCKQDQYYLYNDVARIQFGPEINRIYTASFDFADTLKRSTFYYDNASVREDTVYFDVYAIGGTKNIDRPFTLVQEQLPNLTNAEPGKHYVAFTDQRVAQNYVIKAGTVHTSIPIVLLRDASLKTTTPVLKFVLQADQSFQLGEPSKLWRKLEFTDRLSQPTAWDASMTTYYYGKYSVTKHQFMIETTGQKWDNDFMLAIRSDISLVNYYKATIKIALIDYNKAHPGNPLKDESGELITVPD